MNRNTNTGTYFDIDIIHYILDFVPRRKLPKLWDMGLNDIVESYISARPNIIWSLNELPTNYMYPYITTKKLYRHYEDKLFKRAERSIEYESRNSVRYFKKLFLKYGTDWDLTYDRLFRYDFGYTYMVADMLHYGGHMRMKYLASRFPFWFIIAQGNSYEEDYGFIRTVNLDCCKRTYVRRGMKYYGNQIEYNCKYNSSDDDDDSD